MTVREVFDKYMNECGLNIKQVGFVKLLMEYLMKNGTIEMQRLTQQPFNANGQIYDLFGNDVEIFKKIKQDIENINQNATNTIEESLSSFMKKFPS